MKILQKLPCIRKNIVQKSYYVGDTKQAILYTGNKELKTEKNRLEQEIASGKTNEV
jgi:hypothetical protein